MKDLRLLDGVEINTDVIGDDEGFDGWVKLFGKLYYVTGYSMTEETHVEKDERGYTMFKETETEINIDKVESGKDTETEWFSAALELGLINKIQKSI